MTKIRLLPLSICCIRMFLYSIRLVIQIHLCNKYLEFFNLGISRYQKGGIYIEILSRTYFSYGYPEKRKAGYNKVKRPKYCLSEIASILNIQERFYRLILNCLWINYVSSCGSLWFFMTWNSGRYTPLILAPSEGLSLIGPNQDTHTDIQTGQAFDIDI